VHINLLRATSIQLLLMDFMTDKYLITLQTSASFIKIFLAARSL